MAKPNTLTKSKCSAIDQTRINWRIWVSTQAKSGTQVGDYLEKIMDLGRLWLLQPQRLLLLLPKVVSLGAILLGSPSLTVRLLILNLDKPMLSCREMRCIPIIVSQLQNTKKESIGQRQYWQYLNVLSKYRKSGGSGSARKISSNQCNQRSVKVIAYDDKISVELYKAHLS